MNALRTFVTTAALAVALPFPGAAQAPTSVPAARALTARAAPRTVAAIRTPPVLSTIQGNALNSSNGQMANALVRLRDARFGRIVDTQTTDTSGLFTFRGIEPGNYIVELIGTDSSVLAASQVLNVSAGEAVSAVVKLPFRISPFASILGNSAPSATAVTAAAASSSVLAVTAAGQPTCPTGPAR